MKIILAFALSILAASSIACSGDCVSLCKEAQDRNCTSVHADCSTFCASLEKVSAEGNCGAEHDAYQSCLNADDVCTGNTRCSSQKNALGNCGAAYCVSHSSEQECVTLTEAL